MQKPSVDLALRPGGGFNTSNLAAPARFRDTSSATKLIRSKAINDASTKFATQRIKYSRDELHKLASKFRDVCYFSPELESAIAELASVSTEAKFDQKSEQNSLISKYRREPDGRDWKSRANSANSDKFNRVDDLNRKQSFHNYQKQSIREDEQFPRKSPSISSINSSDYQKSQYEVEIGPNPNPSRADGLNRKQSPQGYQKQCIREDDKLTCKSPSIDSFNSPDYQKSRDGTEISPNSNPNPNIIRAANPWSARRGALSEKEKALRTVKGILNKLTPEKFDVLLGQILEAGINSAEILKDAIALVFDKAVLEPTFCPMYAELCFNLSQSLPEFPASSSDGDGSAGKPVTFRRVLLNSCQEVFEAADSMRMEVDKLIRFSKTEKEGGTEQELELLEKQRLLKLRTMGNVRLIGELFKQKMIPEKIVHYCIQMLLGYNSLESNAGKAGKSDPPAEENLEALCQLFSTAGKQLDESPKSKTAMDIYFSLYLKDLLTSGNRHSQSQSLAPRIKFMIQGMIDLRANGWIPRREEGKARKIKEIHEEAKKKLGIKQFCNSGALSLVDMEPGFVNPILAKMPGAPAPVDSDSDWKTVPLNRKNRKTPLKQGILPTPSLP